MIFDSSFQVQNKEGKKEGDSDEINILLFSPLLLTTWMLKQKRAFDRSL